jgi:hypothetical protein
VFEVCTVLLFSLFCCLWLAHILSTVHVTTPDDGQPWTCMVHKCVSIGPWLFYQANNVVVMRRYMGSSQVSVTAGP